MKTREFKKSNYKAIYHNGKTIRLPININKPITELKFPEFYDIKICSYCRGECSWCYMDSTKKDSFVVDAVQKINKFFGQMTTNERPFQVAIGGGEPTEHPNFVDILYAFYNLGITPNYTTNGMNTSTNILEMSAQCLSTIAVSCHPHLIQYWKNFIDTCIYRKIKFNLQFIISDKVSIDYFKMVYKMYSDHADYFVLLPYIEQGRGIGTKKEINWEYLLEVLPTKKIAFGAKFYDNLIDSQLGISLYEPEILSKFLDLSDMSIHKSSFNLNKE
jgi:organic radical activating enzyme